ncbi:MAG: hypothetical protein L3J43_02065 [Sulfurovum sp.]|nr:hypothetical protein [Sulfurovum sp.]
MTFILIKTIHLFAAFIYGGFLIVDNLFLVHIKKSYSEDEHKKIRESFMKVVRKVVPPSLLVAVITGLYLITQVFGVIDEEGMSRFQILLALKAFLGIWLGVRGFLQVYVGVQPLVFKSHVLPFTFVLTIIFLSQFMYI